MPEIFTNMIRATRITCYLCGIPFWVEEEWDRKRRDRHDTFYCPSGHGQMYTGKSEAEKLRDELTRERQRLDQIRADRDHKDRQLAAAKGQATKLRKRIGAGVCPCCHRTVKQLAAHMRTKHPQYATEKQPS